MAREVWVVENAKGDPDWARADSAPTELSLMPGQRVTRYVPADEIDQLPEHFCLAKFVDAGLSLEDASTALLVSRRILEDAERAREKGIKP